LTRSDLHRARRREADAECRPLAGPAYHRDGATHRLNRLTGDEQADARTLGLSRQDAPQAHEPVEDPFLIFLRDARAVIDNAYLDETIHPARRDFDGTLKIEFQCILEEMVDRLTQTLTIAASQDAPLL
jgi:hypothetical protein